jgi:hypothetical protein
LGIKLYADTETFAVTNRKFVPAEQKRIEEQISIEVKYAEKFAAFSISHYQNRNIISQIDNYNSYYDYYKTNK